MIRVLAIDPGVTTGIAIAWIAPQSTKVACYQGRYSHLQFWQLTTKIAPDVLVCERFDFRNKHRDGLELFSREIIGVAALYCELKERRLVMQTAAQAKGHFNDQKLRKYGLYVKGKGHGRDAVRHLMHWYTFGPGYEYNRKQQLTLVDYNNA